MKEKKPKSPLVHRHKRNGFEQVASGETEDRGRGGIFRGEISFGKRFLRELPGLFYRTERGKSKSKQKSCSPTFREFLNRAASPHVHERKSSFTTENRSCYAARIGALEGEKRPFCKTRPPDRHASLGTYLTHQPRRHFGGEGGTMSQNENHSVVPFMPGNF